MDCYKNTIGDMQNEMNFYGHHNEFEYNHDSSIVFFSYSVKIHILKFIFQNFFDTTKINRFHLKNMNKVMFYKQHILIYLYHLCSDNTVHKYTDDHIV